MGALHPSLGSSSAPEHQALFFVVVSGGLVEFLLSLLILIKIK